MTRPANIVQAQVLNMKIVNNFYAFLFVVTAITLNFTGHRTHNLLLKKIFFKCIYSRVGIISGAAFLFINLKTNKLCLLY